MTQHYAKVLDQTILRDMQEVEKQINNLHIWVFSAKFDNRNIINIKAMFDFTQITLVIRAEFNLQMQQNSD